MALRADDTRGALPRGRRRSTPRPADPGTNTGVRNLGQSGRLRSLRASRARAMQDVLLDGLVETVSLARVHWHVAQQHPLAGHAELQHETVGTIGYLVRAGLVDVGFRGPRGHFVREPLELAMQEIEYAYITHYDEPDEWIWCCWLSLTAAGHQLARSIHDGRRAARRGRKAG